MAQKRIRVFAGPNGSGKSSIFKMLNDQGDINFGVFVNADEIEKSLKDNVALDFAKYNIVVDYSSLVDSYKKSAFYAKSQGDQILLTLNFADNKLSISNPAIINSYFTAFLAGFIRCEMLDCDSTFTIETVMSHSTKLDYLRLAKERGYRVCLYFVSTSDVSINIGRVNQRYFLGGHNVPEEKIKSRYDSSLENL